MSTLSLSLSLSLLCPNQTLNKVGGHNSQYSTRCEPSIASLAGGVCRDLSHGATNSESESCLVYTEVRP